MASVGTVVIEVDADVAKFVEGIQQTNKKISSLERRAREAKKTIANFASAVVGIYAVGEAFSMAKQQASEFLKTASDFEQYENRLSAFYKGQGEVNSEITRAIDFSQEYNKLINDTMDSLITMKVYGIDPTNKALEIFGNTAVGGGKSLDQFVEAMADAFQGENERLKEFGVKASVAGKKVQYAWSDSAGKSRNVVIDANKDIIQSTLETIFNEKYVGQMQLRADSWAGFIDGMKTDYTVFQKQVMDAGVFTYIKALTSSFSKEWTSAIGDTTDSAKMFSDYMQDMIKSSIKAVAFFIDSWTGVKMVWAGLKVAWWGLVNGFQNAMNWTADKWDSMTVGMHNAFKSFIDGAGTAWSNFINFFIKGINTSINAVAGLGNDMLDLMGIDPIKPINISLSKYESSIETAHKSTQKFLNTDYTGSALVDAMVDVQTNYDKLKNNSAQQFVANVLSKVEGEQNKILKNEDELNKKRKDAKKALDDLMKTNEGILKTAKKLNGAKAKGNKLEKEATRQDKEHNKALKEQERLRKKAIQDAINLAKHQRDITIHGYNVQDAQGIYGDYNDQAKRQAEATILGLNARAKELNTPLLNDTQIKKIKANIKKEIIPTFSNGLAEAFNIKSNKPLSDYLSDFGNVLGNIAGNSLKSIINDYSKTGDIKGAINNFTDSNAVSDGLINSGNPYAIALALAGSAIGDALSTPMDAFQSMEVNIGADSTGISDSLSLLADVAYPQLDHTRAMREHLESMDNNFQKIAIGIASSGSYDYSGANFDTQIKDTKLTKFINSLDHRIGGTDFGLGGIERAVTGAIFGTSQSNVTHAGLSFGNQDVGSFINGDVNARSYTDIETVTKRFFGLIKSTSYSTQFGAVDDKLKQQFADSLKYGYEAILEGGVALGLDKNSLSELIKKQTISLGKFDFKGKSQEEISKILSGVFGTQLSSIAESAIPIIKDFKGLSEDYLTALSRVSSGYEQAGEYANQLGIKLLDITDITNKHGNVSTEALRSSIIYGAESTLTGHGFSSRRFNTAIGDMVKTFQGSTSELIHFYTTVSSLDKSIKRADTSFTGLTQTMLDTSGGADSFSRQFDSYLGNFYSSREQLGLSINSVQNELSNLGVDTLPNSVREYRNLVESVDLSTKAGQRLYAQLIGLSDTYSSVLSNALKARKDKEKGTISIYSLMQEYDDKILKNKEDELALSDKIAKATEGMFTSATKSFQDVIDTLRGVKESSNDNRERLLISFNKDQSSLESMLKNNEVDSSLFKDTYDSLLKTASTLGTNSSNYFDGKALSTSLIDQLNTDIGIFGTTDTVAKVEVVSDTSTATANTQDIISRMTKEQELLFAKSHNLNRSQLDELDSISSDGFISRTELESIKTLNRGQLDSLYESLGIAKADNTQNILGYLSNVIARDNTVAKITKEQELLFATSHNLTNRQLVELNSISSDGFITRTELESVRLLSERQLDNLYDSVGIMRTDLAKDETLQQQELINGLTLEEYRRIKSNDYLPNGYVAPTVDNSPTTYTVSSASEQIYKSSFTPTNTSTVGSTEKTLVSILTELKNVKDELNDIKELNSENNKISQDVKINTKKISESNHVLAVSALEEV